MTEWIHSAMDYLTPPEYEVAALADSPLSFDLSKRYPVFQPKDNFPTVK
jgi:hypothetical protein